MRIEKLKEADKPLLEDIHERMGIKYRMPDFTGPMFVIGKVIKSDDGRVQASGAVKIIGEAFLLLDPNLSRYEKAKAVSLLSLSLVREAKEKSLEECSAWIPPDVEKVFAPLLHELGWIESPWRSWSRPLL